MRGYRTRLYQRYFTASYGLDNPADEFGRQRRLDTLKDLLLRWLPAERSARIVDLGCGTGYAVEMLIRNGYTHVEGVDASQEQVAVAEARGLPVVQEDMFRYLPGRHEQFDAVLALDLIEHLDRDELLEFLELAREALRPGGRLIVRTPNANAPTALRMRFRDLTHEIIFTEHSLRMAFLAAGLRPVVLQGERIGAGTILGFGRWLLGSITRFVWRLFLIGGLGREALRIPVEHNLIGVAERPHNTNGP